MQRGKNNTTRYGQKKPAGKDKSRKGLTDSQLHRGKAVAVKVLCILVGGIKLGAGIKIGIISTTLMKATINKNNQTDIKH